MSSCSPVEADLHREEMVLLTVLEWLPVNLTRDELLRNLMVRFKGRADGEPYENAVAELRRLGLLREREDGVIEPTLALLAARQRLDLQVELGSRVWAG